MLIELSYVLGEKTPIWPTNPKEKYDLSQSVKEGAPCNASSVYHHMHNGTHVDAPRHFNPKGRTIEQLPIEDFYYTAPYVLELPKSKGEKITCPDLESVREKIKQCDILLIYTGYSQIRESSPGEFIDNFPSFDSDAARFLRKEFPALKAVAIDTLSVDSAVTGALEGFLSHHAFLDTDGELEERTLLLYEDVNVKKLLGKSRIKSICAFPVRFEKLEAAPVSMVALI